jgi:hypothetical protein
MLRTIMMIGLFAVLGMMALKLTFGILGVFFALFFKLLWMAIWVGAVGLVLYVVIRVISPDTARRLRERFSGGAY